jgi:hypothetical protein
MRVMPIVSAFVIALIGAMAVGLRPGFPFSALLLGATLVAALTGVAASVLQFASERYFSAAAILTGAALGMLVPTLMDLAQSIGFGDLRGGSAVVWPVAAVVGLLFSRSSGMRLPLSASSSRRRG